MKINSRNLLSHIFLWFPACFRKSLLNGSCYGVSVPRNLTGLLITIKKNHQKVATKFSPTGENFLKRNQHLLKNLFQLPEKRCASPASRRTAAHKSKIAQNMKNDLWLVLLILSSTYLSLFLSKSISPCISPALSICVRQLFGLLPVKLHERTGGCTFQPNIALHSGNSLPCLFPSACSLFLSVPSRSSSVVRPVLAFPSSCSH